jgi:hypothetical protein
VEEAVSKALKWPQDVLKMELSELYGEYTRLMDSAMREGNTTAAFDVFDARLVLARYFDVVEELVELEGVKSLPAYDSR